MCLAAPGKIVSIDESVEGIKMARVSFSGVIKNICIEWVPEASIGDYILVHAGTALSIIDAEKAAETEEIFKQWIDSNKKNNI